MINFEEEIKKFHPSLEIEEAEDAIYNNNISDITDEKVSIGPASMYTILKKLVKSELITLEQDDDRKKVYLITDLGVQALEAEVERRKLFYLAGERLLSELRGELD